MRATTRRFLALLSCSSLMVPAAVTVGTPATANGIDPDPCSSTFSGGSGTDSDPYLVASKQDLTDLNGCAGFWANSFLQTANINMAGATWTTTTGTDPDGGTTFSGTYDGGNLTISNLNIDVSDDYVGLFGYVTGDIRNVHLDGTSSVSGYSRVGGLVGELDGGTVSNSSSAANVVSIDDESAIGGLVGRSYGTIRDSYATGDVTGDDNVGGLIGRATSDSLTSGVYATGSVTGGDDTGESVGGLLGSNGGTLTNCYATGNAVDGGNAGGLVGNNSGVISNCYSLGTVDGDQEGGLVAVNSGSVSNSFWDTVTSGAETSAGGTGKTTAELKTLETFTNAGWSITESCDATTIWGLCSTRNSGYPYLTFYTGSPSASPAAETETLNLDNESGVTCANSTVTGNRGQWVAMPGLDDCIVTGQADARVLGWATRANFSVDIARRQVDNGWGAYEWINDEGKVFGVFIPAGGATFLSNSNRLYPIIDVPEIAASQDAPDASDVTSQEAPTRQGTDVLV